MPVVHSSSAVTRASPAASGSLFQRRINLANGPPCRPSRPTAEIPRHGDGDSPARDRENAASETARETRRGGPESGKIEGTEGGELLLSRGTRPSVMPESLYFCPSPFRLSPREGSSRLTRPR